MRPSFVSLAIGGILIAVAIIMIYMRYDKLSSSELISIILLLSIATSAHGFLHSQEEIHFDYNPLIGHWNARDRPTTPPIEKIEQI